MSTSLSALNPNLKEITEKDLKSNPSLACGFCNRCKINNLEWGTMYKLGSISVHYFCLLFSAKLSQNGEDEEGVLGFLSNDIKKEFARGAKLKCTYCKQSRATVGCSVKACKKSFHYTCGYENACHFQFVGAYEGYCPHHKPKINITLPNSEDWVCPICFCGVEENEGPICPPCCGKAVFHRKCVMKFATSSGYFFKCPLCNDKKKFELEMKMSGVYVPQMDAAWERDPNAFADQVSQYSTCDADECLCPHGRNHNEKETKWNLSRCGGCGSSAMHKECGKLPTFSWKCPTCESVLAGTGLLSSQSSEDSDAGSANASQNIISRGARISRPDFYADNNYKSSSEDEEPVENVVGVIQSAPTIHDLENDFETPPPSRNRGLLRFNQLVIDSKKNLVYDGLHRKKYIVEGGRGIINKDRDEPSCSSKVNNVNTSSVPYRNSNATILSDSAVIVAADINSLKDENIQEKLAQLKNVCQQLTKNKPIVDNSEIKMRATECEQSSLDFLETSKIVRRKLDFAGISVPSISVQNSLNLGSEVLLSQITTKTNLDTNPNDLQLKNTQAILTPSMIELNDSPELTRSNWSSTANYENFQRSSDANSSIENTSQIPTAVNRASKSNLNNSINDDIEVINLDDTAEDDDDDIQICDYVRVPTIKILSVASLNPAPYIPKSAAFLSMIDRFNEHRQRPWVDISPRGGISKENVCGEKKRIEEIILESDDDDLEVLEICSSPMKEQYDVNGKSTSSRSWQSSPLENTNSKRPRLSPD